MTLLVYFIFEDYIKDISFYYKIDCGFCIAIFFILMSFLLMFCHDFIIYMGCYIMIIRRSYNDVYKYYTYYLDVKENFWNLMGNSVQEAWVELPLFGMVDDSKELDINTRQMVEDLKSANQFSDIYIKTSKWIHICKGSYGNIEFINISPELDYEWSWTV